MGAQAGKLAPKQELFVMYYINDPKLNGKKAAINAGYAPKTAEITASKLLRIAKVASAIEERMRDRKDRLRISADQILYRLTLLAQFNINKFLAWTEEGTPYYDFSLATDDDWYCITEITIDRLNKGNVEIEMIENDEGELVPKVKKISIDRVRLKSIDKIKALELAGRHIDVQAFKDKVEVEDVTDRAAAMKRARQRALEDKGA